jgi:hypothetical protein
LIQVCRVDPHYFLNIAAEEGFIDILDLSALRQENIL